MNGVNSAVQALYASTISGSEFEAEIGEFIASKEGFTRWTHRLRKLDARIGFVGVHNVNKPRYNEDRSDLSVTGAYHSLDRDVFRPLQYCAAMFLTHFIDADTRYLVDNSCGHVESLLKRILAHSSGDGDVEKPMGGVIHDLAKSPEPLRSPGPNLLDVSTLVNAVYRDAKHEFEFDPFDRTLEYQSDLDLTAHLFSYDEAVLIYFGCRIHGIRLMEWMRERVLA